MCGCTNVWMGGLLDFLKRNVLFDSPAIVLLAPLDKAGLNQGYVSGVVPLTVLFFVLKQRKEPKENSRLRWKALFSYAEILFTRYKRSCTQARASLVYRLRKALAQNLSSKTTSFHQGRCSPNKRIRFFKDYFADSISHRGCAGRPRKVRT